MRRQQRVGQQAAQPEILGKCHEKHRILGPPRSAMSARWAGRSNKLASKAVRPEDNRSVMGAPDANETSKPLDTDQTWSGWTSSRMAVSSGNSDVRLQYSVTTGSPRRNPVSASTSEAGGSADQGSPGQNTAQQRRQWQMNNRVRYPLCTAEFVS
jgi:hypothetical protein